MRFLTFRKTLLALALFGFYTNVSFCQEGKTNITQDTRFEELLNEKRKINTTATLNDRFKIQIYTGDSENSKKSFAEFRKNNKNTDATIIFQTPIYKVWVGNFKTRIEAEKKLKEMSKKYPNAFLIKPNK
jgi:hypothetical protein